MTDDKKNIFPFKVFSNDDKEEWNGKDRRDEQKLPPKMKLKRGSDPHNPTAQESILESLRLERDKQFEETKERNEDLEKQIALIENELAEAQEDKAGISEHVVYYGLVLFGLGIVFVYMFIAVYRTGGLEF